MGHQSKLLHSQVMSVAWRSSHIVLHPWTAAIPAGGCNGIIFKVLSNPKDSGIP